MRFVAMNNFQVAADQVAQFEERWQRRRSYLQGTPGFESFLVITESIDPPLHRSWSLRRANSPANSLHNACR